MNPDAFERQLAELGDAELDQLNETLGEYGIEPAEPPTYVLQRFPRFTPPPPPRTITTPKQYGQSLKRRKRR